MWHLVRIVYQNGYLRTCQGAYLIVYLGYG